MHGIALLEMKSVADAVLSDRLSADLPVFTAQPPHGRPFEVLERHDALERLVAPALAAIIGDERIRDLIVGIRWLEGCVDCDLPPYTADNGAGASPDVHIHWEGRASDIVCLAHEVAHAVQIQLAAGRFMPPVARETCAFLGELALIERAGVISPALRRELTRVWNEENAIYLGSDCALLRSSLAQPDTAYHYRLNYPLARLAAYELFQKRELKSLRRLFEAGESAMDLLPLGELTEDQDGEQSMLPPMAEPDTTYQSLNAYRTLGAMALLDLDHGEDEAALCIDQYYAPRRDHLRRNTVFLGLDRNRRPIGYASWQASDGCELILEHHCEAPGRRMQFQQLLEDHLGSLFDSAALPAFNFGREELA